MLAVMPVKFVDTVKYLGVYLVIASTLKLSAGHLKYKVPFW